jgi:hypothetical protein
MIEITQFYVTIEMKYRALHERTLRSSWRMSERFLFLLRNGLLFNRPITKDSSYKNFQFTFDFNGLNFSKLYRCMTPVNFKYIQQQNNSIIWGVYKYVWCN